MLENLQALWSLVLIETTGGVVVTVGRVVLVVLLFLAAWVTLRVSRRLLVSRLTRAKLQADAVVVIDRVVFYVALLTVVLLALGLLGIPLGAFAFISGAVAVGVGFGAQNIINNFLSGWILMTERPVKINDFVEIDNAFGQVEKIGNRSTRIRRVDGVHMLVPNSQLLERVVVNWTLIDKRIRTVVRIGVAYGSPVRLVADLIAQTLGEQADILEDPAPKVIFEDFGDSALIFDAYFWADVDGERDLRRIRSAIRFRITELFAENDITIAFPQRDVHLDATSVLPVKVVETSEQESGSS